MQRLEVSGALRPLYGSLGVKGLMWPLKHIWNTIHFFPGWYSRFPRF